MTTLTTQSVEMPQESPRRTCSLIVTHQCNLNCRYCYECFKSSKAMTLDTAKEVVQAEFAAADGCEAVIIEFMGGEPMVQFPLIRRIAEWIWSKAWPKPYILSTTTNGTLFTPEAKQWFCRHAKRFYVGLSLDGTPEMQRTNRGCSFTDIDLAFFLHNWPEQDVKMTVSCETVSTLAAGIIHLQELGFQVHANLGYGMPWDDSTLDVFANQLRILGEYYLDHPEVAPVSLLDLKIEVILNDKHPIKKYCGTGTHMGVYDVDGTRYPCHLFTPLVLTRDCIELSRRIDFSDDRRLVDPKCWGCIGRDLCPTCYGFNFKLTGDPALRDPVLCRLFKVQMRENIRFQAALLRRRKGEFSRDDCKKAKAILKMHQYLVSCC